MASCFDTIIGLSDRDCDCFATGRPDGSGLLTQQKLSWEFQKFTCPDTPPSPFTLTTTFNLPTDDPEANIQLFAGTALEKDVDFTITGANQITITTPVPGQVYQVWYLATIQAVLSVAEYTQSDSGLYITDLLPEEEIAGMESCDETIWDLLVKARQTAIREFQAALNTTMVRRFQVKQETFEGFIGEARGAQYMTTTPVYAGIRIRTNAVRSGYLKIKRILALFEATGTISCTIYNKDGIAVSPAFDIDTAANGRAVTDVNITLPLLGDFESEQDYFLVYTYNAANKPKLNLTVCGCGTNKFTPHTDVNNYPVAAKYTGKNAWHNWILVGGWQQDDLDFSSASDQVSTYMNGLALEVEVGCDIAEGLCNMLGNFDSNQYAMSSAMAIQRKAAAYLVKRRRSASTPNRNNLVMTKGLQEQVAEWEGDFAEIMQFLTTNIPSTANDCLECKARTQLTGIFG